MHARLKLSLVLPRAYVWLSIHRRPYTHTNALSEESSRGASVPRLRVARVQGPIFICFQIRFLLRMSHLRLTSNTLQRSGLVCEI